MNQPNRLFQSTQSVQPTLNDFINEGIQLQPYSKAKKTTIYRQNDNAQSLFQVQSGIIKNFRTTAEGIEQITHFHLPGEIFGFEALVSNRYSSNTMTVTDSSVTSLPIKEYTLHPEAYSSLNRQLAQEYIHSKNHIATLNKTRAIVKVATFILDISKRLNIDKTDSHGFQFPRTDMANYLGLSVETVCREIKQLKEYKAIEIKKTRIIIVDSKQLTGIIKQ